MELQVLLELSYQFSVQEAHSRVFFKEFANCFLRVGRISSGSRKGFLVQLARSSQLGCPLGNRFLETSANRFRLLEPCKAVPHAAFCTEAHQGTSSVCMEEQNQQYNLQVSAFDRQCPRLGPFELFQRWIFASRSQHCVVCKFNCKAQGQCSPRNELDFA